MSLGYGGTNTDSSAVSDGRRMSARKCKHCDNAVFGQNRICGVCHQRSFEKDSARKNARSKARAAAARAAGEMKGSPLSDALSGLQSRWFNYPIGAA